MFTAQPIVFWALLFSFGLFGAGMFWNYRGSNPVHILIHPVFFIIGTVTVGVLLALGIESLIFTR